MVSTRRLAAILAADVAGYSRLMGLDEEGTHERFKAHCREVFEPRIRQHHGRIVKSTGDGMLVEFPSVVEAVLCAVEVQCGISRRNAEVSDRERVSFRIGINIGDVIVEPHDIFGDGVNVAARLEGLAEPNGICISGVVHEQIRDKLPYLFDDLGPQTVKNIARPLQAFVLRPQVIADLPLSIVPMPAPQPEPVEHGAGASAGRAPRLSVVVLPFANLSDDREQQYLADAITDDVTTDLSRIANMVVISRNTADTYRGKPVNTRQIGHELNVRYVLEGSVRRADNRIRVNAQLIDADADTYVWADRFDHASDDLFRLQDQVTSQIAVALNLELIDAEAARPTDNPDALDCILRGRAALSSHGGLTPERYAQAIEWFDRARSLDPHSVDAQALLAFAYVSRALEQISLSAAADVERAERLIETALAAAPRHAVAHFAKGHLLRAQGRYEAAIPEYETAIALNRNSVVAIANLGLCKFFTGAIEESIPAQEMAIRLSPRDPRVPNWYWRIGMVHLLQSRVDEAIQWIEKARTANPSLPGPYAWLAAAYALGGDMARAGTALATARRLSPDNRYASIARFKSIQSLGSPTINTLAEATFLAGLRRAGVPED
ncbi:MAG TPA: adenylate/guanylate cyclase domain-containing protein [Stellaceae bacterium]|nr:adenylate/guanylate cyclase domain-containing protein [Stellaceae bacterium]